MGRETERKFLVRGEFQGGSTGKEEIVQAYLVKDAEKVIRIRISDDRAWLTIKSKPQEGSFSRGEWEYPIPEKDARDLLSMCLPGRIVKTRYFVPAGKHVFEVDVFHGRNEGLVVAEIELTDESDEFERPVWLGKEVTGDPAYYNSNLVRKELFFESEIDGEDKE
ncbi:MAG TPA: CYTH domain-containing protein [Bacteroidales bacterium]|nr:CYTH domain-containing protein [Bacteroidales bacterium]